MTSFSIKISDRRNVFLALVRDVQHSLNVALEEEHAKRGLTQAEIVKFLGKHKSVISRAFLGTGNLTLETIADLAFALDRIPQISLLPAESENGRNDFRDSRANIDFTTNQLNILHESHEPQISLSGNSIFNNLEKSLKISTRNVVAEETEINRYLGTNTVRKQIHDEVP